MITVHNKHNILLPDTFVGQVSVPLDKIESGGSVQHYPLHNKKDEQSGDISLEMVVLPPGMRMSQPESSCLALVERVLVRIAHRKTSRHTALS